jgi:hypothetical protein
MMALVTVSAIFLRWLPHYGFPILLLFGVSAGGAAVIYLTQRRRYLASSHGIVHDRADADISAVLWTSVAGLALGVLGIVVVLVG